MTDTQIVPGLAGVPVVESKIGYIDGEQGILEYRGYSIESLCEHSSFSETAYLLVHGNLPSQEQLKRWDYDLTTHRRLKYKILDLVRCLPEYGHPMEALQAVVAALGMFYRERDETDPDAAYWATVRLIAKLPTAVAAFERLRKGDHEIWPRDDLSLAGNFLYMVNDRVPTPLEERVLDTCLILHAEHTINASTFSALVTGSALADPYSVVSSAIGTLSGPLHGGANERVLLMLREIGSVENVRPWLDNKIANKEKIMGLGHRVYKTKDPRATMLQKLVQPLFEESGATPLYLVAQELEKAAAEKLGHKGIWPNVDFYSGFVYERLGVSPDTFTCLFAMARVSGWLAHLREQLKDNRIFRPTQIYVGAHSRPFVPLEER